MNTHLENFIERAEILHDYLADLYKTATVLPWIPADLVPATFKELHKTSKIVLLAVEELHQQNEELIETCNLLESQRQNYQELFEYAPIAYLVTNQQGIIQQANLRAAELLNISPNFLVGKPIITFIPHEQHQNFYNYLDQISKSERIQEIFLPIQPRHQDYFDACCTVRFIPKRFDQSLKLLWLIYQISSHDPVKSKSQKNYTDLLADRPIHKYAKGENIQLSPKSIYYVCNGLVKLSTICETGEEILTGLATSGMIFGAIMTPLNIYQATALADVELHSFYTQEIEFCPLIKEIFLSKIQQRLQQAEFLLYILGRRKVQDRLLYLLQLLKQIIGEPLPGGTRLTFRLTHEDMANACGTTRVTVTRLLGEFQEQGMISFDSQKHIICKKLKIE